jgi:hypothetical protein
MASGGYIAQQMGGLQFFFSEFRKSSARRARRNS